MYCAIKDTEVHITRAEMQLTDQARIWFSHRSFSTHTRQMHIRVPNFILWQHNTKTPKHMPNSNPVSISHSEKMLPEVASKSIAWRRNHPPRLLASRSKFFISHYCSSADPDWGAIKFLAIEPRTCHDEPRTWRGWRGFNAKNLTNFDVRIPLDTRTWSNFH